MPRYLGSGALRAPQGRLDRTPVFARVDGARGNRVVSIVWREGPPRFALLTEDPARVDHFRGECRYGEALVCPCAGRSFGGPPFLSLAFVGKVDRGAKVAELVVELEELS